jgi:hypothetical protein
MLNGSSTMNAGAPKIAKANEMIARSLFKLNLAVSLFFLIFEDQSQTIPRGQAYLQIQRFLKNIITRVRSPKRWRMTIPFIAKTEFRNMYGLTHIIPPESKGKGKGIARIIARTKNKYLIFFALRIIPGIRFELSICSEVS